MPYETPTPIFRQALRSDVPALMRVRYAVQENRLVSRVISDAEVIDQIENTGRGWVVEVAGEVVGFAIGNTQDGNIWALFLDPAHAGRGFGRRLHDTMLAWLWSQGVEHLWLTTAPGTRAEGFYRAAGWRDCGLAHGEVRFEMDAP
jgi:GNAT superfamily N-acetyltransferase